MNFLPDRDREYLISKGISFEEVEDNGKKAVILKEQSLPVGRFDQEEVDVLIQLPRGYADVAPDMFYLLPWVKSVATKLYPPQADQPFNFGGQKWQRWSRHNNDWRPGIDGIWTMIKRIEYAWEITR
ncbi:MAG: hypothetical protein OXC38_00245 [Gammaproteobacteria bacterium]|nr:hypothetical protein [Gammaproteobacteria bacterium]